MNSDFLNTVVVVAIFVGILTACGQRRAQKVYFYEDKKVANVVSLNNDIIDGYCYKYYKNGKIKQKVYFSGGEGFGVEFSNFGTVIGQGEYRSSNHLGIEALVRHGEHVFYYHTGVTNAIINFNKGVFHGEFCLFYKSGNKYIDGFYKDGRKDSVWTFFSTTGEISRTQKYQGGELISAKLYQNLKFDSLFVLYPEALN